MWIFVLSSLLIARSAVRGRLWQDVRVPADLVRNRYQLEQTLGHGGVSVVWRAHDLQLGRQVAVKQLTPAALDDPTALERVHREARTIAGLVHPNIVALHDFGFDDQAPYLVLELVDGPSLAAVLIDGPLPITQTVDIGRQTCQALAAAHAAGVIHRDIKPANLLLRPDRLVKVCDFGIAHLQNTPTLSPPAGGGAALGTSHYMAPETVSGDPVDARTDLYAVGCLLYAMLTGHPPFTGDNPVGVAVQHLHDTPVAVHHLRPDTPPALSALVHELLAKDPADRPSRADEVAQRLATIPVSTSAVPAGWIAAAAPPVAAPDPTTYAFADSAATAAIPRTPTQAGRHWRSDAAEPPWRRPAAIAGGVIVAAAIAVVLAVQMILGGDNQDDTTAPATSSSNSAAAVAPATAEPAASTAPTPTPTPSPTPSPTQLRAVRPADLIAGIQASVSRLQRDGHLDAKAAKELNKRLDETFEALAEGRDDKAWDKLRETAEKVTNLRDEGKLTPAGYDVLAPQLTQLAAALQRR